jgi:hypothetical protein
MQRTRAYRRHQLSRAKRRAYRLLRHIFSTLPEDPEPHPTTLGIFRNTRRPCSCWCCGGHRRKRGGLTRAELVAELSATEQIRE